jgi:hypothetical protein
MELRSAQAPSFPSYHLTYTTRTKELLTIGDEGTKIRGCYNDPRYSCLTLRWRLVGLHLPPRPFQSMVVPMDTDQKVTTSFEAWENKSEMVTKTASRTCGF